MGFIKTFIELCTQIELLEQTLEQMDNENGNAALWFADRIQNLLTKTE